MRGGDEDDNYDEDRTRFLRSSRDLVMCQSACSQPERLKAGSLLARPPAASIPLRPLGGGASLASATTGKRAQRESAPEGAGALRLAKFLAPPSGRIRLFGEIPVVALVTLAPPPRRRRGLVADR